MNKKILVSCIVLAIAIGVGGNASATSFDKSQCEFTHFKVTSYYSPLKGQDFYYRGNFEDEVILNGKGTHGASGAPVFNGMIAAPKTYAFGTKIYFPGRGIGQVEDRGGAIVEKGERTEATYDRIDIWAGKGEEGLQRALSFGVQYLDAYICPEGVISEEAGFDYNAFPQFAEFFHQSLWVLQLWPERKDPWVGALQDFLIAMGYMKDGRATNFYGEETEKGVCDFQNKNMGIAKNSEWCGHFGPQTRYSLKQAVKKLGLLDANGKPIFKKEHASPSADGVTASKTEIQKPTDKAFDKTSTLNERIINHLFTEGEFKYYEFTRAFKKGEQAKEIRILQRKLQWLGFIDKEAVITGIYDKSTIEAIFAFQKEKGILTGKEDVAVQGYFGEKTRNTINNL